MIAVIDYGAGNLHSVMNALTHLGIDAMITNDSATLQTADGAILPGVGAFGDAMKYMNQKNMKDGVLSFITSGKPFLGICLGLQLLFEGSEESPSAEGLNIFNETIKKLQNNGIIKIPHIGWNSIDFDNDCPLFKDINSGSYFYFNHSYCYQNIDDNIAMSTTDYGIKFVSSLQQNNLFAVQFHPEKSGDIGMKLLQNFVDLTL
ncbi:MAG: imidazole glycerol phosphate synthase subunit HisH [Bacillota bacterium]|nr:imidazole glycerol phosphate synthase subunit HisH [Bacillota bacterium]